MRVLVYMAMYNTGKKFEKTPYAAYTSDINRNYSVSHGYSFKCFGYPTDIDMSDRHPAWSRVYYAIKQAPLYDYILYLDGDAFVFDPKFELEVLVNKYFSDDHTLFLASRDQKLMNSVFHCNRPNAGVFLIKCTDDTQSLLDAWWNVPYDEYYSGKVIKDSERYLDHKDTLFNHPYEQLALWFLRDRYPSSFKFVDSYRELNGLDGRFVRHLIQVPEKIRIRILQEFVKERYNVNQFSQEPDNVV